MKNLMKVVPVLALFALLGGSVANTQQPAPDQGQKRVANPSSPALQLQFVLSKYRNDKKISSRPYTVVISGPGGAKGTLRVVSDVPVPAYFTPPKTDAAGGAPPQRAFNYRGVGTTIVCSAEVVEGGQYRLDVNIDDSSVQKNSDTTVEAPVFQSFSIRGGPIMKDGQTTQLSSATDPVSGEVMRVDVTLTIVK